MYYTGLDPRTMEKVYVPTDPHEKAMQRALIQYRNPKNYYLVKEALLTAHREDLIGSGPKCLIRAVPPRAGSYSAPPKKAPPKAPARAGATPNGKPSAKPSGKPTAKPAGKMPVKAAGKPAGRPAPKHTGASPKGRPSNSKKR